MYTPRAEGILVMGQGVIIRAFPQRDDCTAIELAPGHHIGNIVQDADGQWRYDEPMRTVLGIEEDPSFDTDVKAGNALRDHLPPLEQVNAFGRGLTCGRYQA